MIRVGHRQLSTLCSPHSAPLPLVPIHPRRMPLALPVRASWVGSVVCHWLCRWACVGFLPRRRLLHRESNGSWVRFAPRLPPFAPRCERNRARVNPTCTPGFLSFFVRGWWRSPKHSWDCSALSALPRTNGGPRGARRGEASGSFGPGTFASPLEALAKVAGVGFVWRGHSLSTRFVRTSHRMFQTSV